MTAELAILQILCGAATGVCLAAVVIITLEDWLPARGSKKKHNQQLRDAQRIIQYYKNQLQDADRAYEVLAERYRKVVRSYHDIRRDSFRP